MASVVWGSLSHPVHARPPNQLATGKSHTSSDSRYEANFSVLVGRSEVGSSTNSAGGVGLMVGYRRAAWSVFAEAQTMSTARGTDNHKGRMDRLGLTARYALLELAKKRSPFLDLWVEGGVGRHRVSWLTGGRLSRNDLVLGFGVHVGGRAKKRNHRARYLAPFFAVRTHVAKGPTVGEKICGGPCDTATTPRNPDVSVFFHTGLYVGR